ncbi:MAG: bis(5'-nucleosyl)-tetraphosphatase (symmetrical) YqeK [Sarcina sp.]
MLEESLKQYLKENLSEKRYRHTLGVCETAIKLAKLYDADEEKAKIAALGHDLAKELCIDEQKELLKKNNFEIGEIEEASPQILHGFVGSILLKDLFNVEDKEILDAIDFHSTGKKEMTTLEKIIYIADYIEPNRNYNGVEHLRETTFNDLDAGVLEGLDNTIKLVVEQRKVIHPLTLEARNYLVMEMMKK